MNAPHTPPHAAAMAQPPLVPLAPGEPYVDRTERGLVVRGTRLTLYQLWEHLENGASHEQARENYRLSEDQLAGILRFIEANRSAFELEYRYILARAEENRLYWQEENRELLARIAATPPTPGREAAHAMLRERKRQFGIQ